MMGDAFRTTLGARNGRFGETLLGSGHYAGVIDIGQGKALTLHVDGVGTKVLLAQLMDKYDTVGIDCVAMTANDLLCLGSEPVALLDYLALEREDDVLVEEIAKGLRAGAKKASVSIVGGETAVLGDVIKGVNGRGFDLAAMGVGVVERKNIVDGSRIVAGDELVGLRSSGLHSNGYTLVRKLFSKRSLTEMNDQLGQTLGEELLTPTEIYVAPVLEIIRKVGIHGLAHITGGAFSKLTRLTGDRELRFRLTRMPAPPIFDIIKEDGKVTEREMYRTFNMGVGFCLVAPRTEVENILTICGRHRLEAFRLGVVERGLGVRVGKLKVA